MLLEPFVNYNLSVGRLVSKYLAGHHRQQAATVASGGCSKSGRQPVNAQLEAYYNIAADSVARSPPGRLNMNLPASPMAGPGLYFGIQRREQRACHP